ncbi:uncharacterized protein ASCRUDRAFT_76553 [Ascoidea rubescens DSM 1968]|uniref:FAR1 domain-containing protein n=1 Tax=Ascoidea rubescens DSM 1968 TaxID=1344418 RepID=A0A1D2VEL6_9ASCO|nr:hypothetical protein ASCRUDRAFT_76553 [Ascoidea rubescens DSM 1968]ODV60022.1 hypothetical protein ASCRUDRAFT_76553 [Ascoidea rubescens DSM 1968]
MTNLNLQLCQFAEYKQPNIPNPGDTFISKADVMQKIKNEWSQKNGVGLCIKYNDKYRMVFKCQFHGTKVITPESSKRQRNSKKLGCKFEIKVKFVKLLQLWQVVEGHNTHNGHLYLLYKEDQTMLRKRSPEVKRMIQQMVNAGKYDTATLYNLIRHHFNIPIIKKDLLNDIAAAKRKLKLSTPTDANSGL